MALFTRESAEVTEKKMTPEFFFFFFFFLFFFVFLGVQVAVKIPKVEDLTQEKVEEFRAELKVMSRIVHPRVVALLGAFIPTGLFV